MLVAFASIVAAYLVGSIASAIITCRLMGLPDPRTGGSGNPGATNVLRLGGKTAAALTLAGDVLKGYLPTAVAATLGVSPAVLAGVALAAFVGHLYPVFFQFKGGKGVATALGALAGLVWTVAASAALTWIVVAAATRYSSLAALAAAVCAPFYTALLTREPALAIGVTTISVLLVWRHHANIKRLLSGTEAKLGGKAKPAPSHRG